MFAIYFTLPAIALSALPVKEIDGELTTLLALPPEEGGFANDPVLGLVENLGLSGFALDAIKIYVGILAATILFIATNAGVIGASRITYSMASYRQFPEVFRRLHPRFKTPWLSLVVFAGVVSILAILPGQTDFLGTMYSFGAMLSFTVAHASIVALRARSPRRRAALPRPSEPADPRDRLAAVRDPRRARDGPRLARRRRPGSRPPARRASAGSRSASSIYFVYRRRVVHEPLAATVRAPAAYGPALALEYRRLLVPVAAGSGVGRRARRRREPRRGARRADRRP